MAYGYQQFDENGDVMFDSTSPIHSIIKYDTITITLYKDSNFGATTFDYTLPGCTSLQDVIDNYIIEQQTGDPFSLLTARTPYGVTFVSNNTIRFDGSGGCTDLFGNPGQCTSLDFQTVTYNIYTIGKTL